MKQGYRFRAFTASYSWAARHFSADTFSCSENPSLNSLMETGRMAPCNEHKSLLLFEHQKTRHNLDWTRTSISELSVRHSAIELHAQGGHNLDCCQCLFMERDTGVAPVTSPWQGDELLLHQTRNKQQAQLTVQNMLLLQQGILNHCCWSTHRILPPGIRLGRPSFCF